MVKSFGFELDGNNVRQEVENLDLFGDNIGRSKFISFGWTGMYHEQFTNLYHTLFREYDAYHERWLSPDPAGYADGLNLYAAYMGVYNIDPMGLWAWDDNWVEATLTVVPYVG